jgi:hypothetical protein
LESRQAKILRLTNTCVLSWYRFLYVQQREGKLQSPATRSCGIPSAQQHNILRNGYGIVMKWSVLVRSAFMVEGLVAVTKNQKKLRSLCFCYLTRSIDLRSPGPSVTRMAFGDNFFMESTSCGGKGSPRPHRTRKYSPGAPLTRKVPCSFVDP